MERVTQLFVLVQLEEGAEARVVVQGLFILYFAHRLEAGMSDPEEVFGGHLGRSEELK